MKKQSPLESGCFFLWAYFLLLVLYNYSIHLKVSIIIPFNKPFIIGNELEYIREAVDAGKISGDGDFTFRCQRLMENLLGFRKVQLTTSCTDALEMCALLLDIKPGDRVIMPSFNFVSAANAFALRGATIDFADIDPVNLTVSPEEIARLITDNTRAVVVMHYGGVACKMEEILELLKDRNIYLIEDAALAFESYYTDSTGEKKLLGTFGDLSTFSFHETKNIICGEGGALVINNPEFDEMAEVIREKGTDRSKLFRGEVDKYTWKALGSSFLPSDINAAFLFGQLECFRNIINKRVEIWNLYHEKLKVLEETGKVKLPYIPEYATVNGQMFWLLCHSEDERDALIAYLKEREVKAVFHYLPLHLSPWYLGRYEQKSLPETEKASRSIIRLPMYYELETSEVEFISEEIIQFYHNM